MKNTLENKAKFFALYWGQEVMYELNTKTRKLSKKLKIGDYLPSHYLLPTYLELTPLSKISDEDAIEVAKLVSYRFAKHYEKDVITFKMSEKQKLSVWLLVNNSPKYVINITNDGVTFQEFNPMYSNGGEDYYTPNQYKITNFLLSKGYYLGDGCEVNYGWVELKTE